MVSKKPKMYVVGGGGGGLCLDATWMVLFLVDSNSSMKTKNAPRNGNGSITKQRKMMNLLRRIDEIKKCSINIFTKSEELCTLYFILQQRDHNLRIAQIGFLDCTWWQKQLQKMWDPFSRIWQKLLETTLLCPPGVATKRFASDDTEPWLDLGHLGVFVVMVLNIFWWTDD